MLVVDCGAVVVPKLAPPNREPEFDDVIGKF